MGIDLGEKRVGLAVSDELCVMAHPVGFLPYEGREKTVDKVIKLAREHGCSAFVVGMPLNMDGSKGEAALRAERFARSLQARSGLKVWLYDERLSTSQAEKEMIGFGMSRQRRRVNRDALASAIILEGFLASMRPAIGREGERNG